MPLAREMYSMGSLSSWSVADLAPVVCDFLRQQKLVVLDQGRAQRRYELEKPPSDSGKDQKLTYI